MPFSWMLSSMTSLIPQSFLAPTTCDALTHYTSNTLILSRLHKTTKRPLIRHICLTRNVLTVHLRTSAFITVGSCQGRSTPRPIRSSGRRKNSSTSRKILTQTLVCAQVFSLTPFSPSQTLTHNFYSDKLVQLVLSHTSV